jgi:1,4-dihydroxy-2-naphthoate octaprenyltransferase/putative NADPH-quinone reductase
LGELQFEKDVVVPSPQYQSVEADIQRAKKLIIWAEHLVFVFPTWWGGCPALLKAFIDRTLIPGFAFREIQPDAFDKLLAPRTAQLITTMDTPVTVDLLINGAPAVKSLTNATLKFCGVRPVRIMRLSPIKHSTVAQKQQWLQQVYLKGRSLERGVLNPWEKLWNKVHPWIKAIRLQFYPMTFFAYGIGAFAASDLQGKLDVSVFVLGYLLLFMIEVIVVFNNEYNDRETDKRNRFYSPFSGGSRVLVSGLISEVALNRAMLWLGVICLLLTFLVAVLAPTATYIPVVLVLTLAVIAISYTAPPLKLSYRGVGEFVVAFTHSFAVIICGFVFQGGSIGRLEPWALGLPLFLSIAPAIIMAGVPDMVADEQVGKKTLAVRLGRVKASYTAALFVILSCCAAILLTGWSYIDAAYGMVIYLALIHALVLVCMLFAYARNANKPDRIDGILVAALSYIMWFALVPFIHLI